MTHSYSFHPRKPREFVIRDSSRGEGVFQIPGRDSPESQQRAMLQKWQILNRFKQFERAYSFGLGFGQPARDEALTRFPAIQPIRRRRGDETLIEPVPSHWQRNIPNRKSENLPRTTWSQIENWERWVRFHQPFFLHFFFNSRCGRQLSHFPNGFVLQKITLSHHSTLCTLHSAFQWHPVWKHHSVPK